MQNYPSYIFIFCLVSFFPFCIKQTCLSTANLPPSCRSIVASPSAQPLPHSHHGHKIACRHTEYNRWMDGQPGRQTERQTIATPIHSHSGTDRYSSLSSPSSQQSDNDCWWQRLLILDEYNFPCGRGTSSSPSPSSSSSATATTTSSLSAAIIPVTSRDFEGYQGITLKNQRESFEYLERERSRRGNTYVITKLKQQPHQCD